MGLNDSFFIPAKITDVKWADKLLDGEVYMRPLNAFASYEASHPSLESFRGDRYEGISSISYDVENDFVAQMIDERIRNQIKGIIQIDSEELPFYKLFCLYCIRYDFLTNSFYKPDLRMKKFGDTVVVFRNFNLFLNRFLDALVKIYGDMFVFLCDQVEYLDFNNPKRVFPIFTKRPDFFYQNELRLAIGELCNPKDGFYEIKKSLNNFNLYIGSIRDIADEMSFDDFYSQKGLDIYRYSFPMTSSSDIKSLYSQCVTKTHKLIEYNLRNRSKKRKSFNNIQKIELVRYISG